MISIDEILHGISDDVSSIYISLDMMSHDISDLFTSVDMISDDVANIYVSLDMITDDVTNIYISLDMIWIISPAEKSLIHKFSPSVAMPTGTAKPSAMTSRTSQFTLLIRPFLTPVPLSTTKISS